MDQITEQLWIGDIDDAREGDTSKFDRVVSVCQDHAKANVSDDIPYRHFKLADSPDTAGMYGGRCDYGLFRTAAHCVWRALLRGETVLVHCHVGQNRSAAVCMAALAKYQEIHFDDAYQRVAEMRPMVNPMPTMERYARRYAQS